MDHKYVVESAQQSFCCRGCASAHAVLERIQRNELDTKSLPKFWMLENELVTPKLSPDGQQMKFFVEGMDCISCLPTLERLPEWCAEIEALQVDFSHSSVRVKKSQVASFAQVASIIEQFGYVVHAIDWTQDQSTQRKTSARWELARLATAGFATGNVMLFAVSNYGGADGSIKMLFDWSMAAIGTPALLFAGWPIYRRALKGLLQFQINLDLPIALALLSGLVMSWYALLTHGDHIYFDSLSMLLFLLCSTRYFFKSVQERFLNIDYLNEAFYFKPVQLRQNDGWRWTQAQELKAGDQFLTSPQTLLAVDAELLSERAVVDSSLLTGESHLMTQRKGEIVLAGAVVKSTEALFQVVHESDKTQLSDLIHSPQESAEHSKSFWSDDIGKYFALAQLFTVAVLFFIFDQGIALQRSLLLLIVTCPCVFGMALPLAEALSIKKLLKKKVVVRNIGSFADLAKCGHIVFDKTGTLTEGSLALEPIKLDAIHLDSTKGSMILSRFSAQELLYELERNQIHPVAAAVRRHYTAPTSAPAWTKEPLFNYQQMALEGEIEGVLIALYSEVNEHGQSLRLEVDSQTIAQWKVTGSIKRSAPQLLQNLEQAHLKSFILSGDHEQNVAAVAKELHIPTERTWWKKMPQQKMELIESLNPCCFVGDGANDILAMQKSSVSIAINGPIALTMKHADIIFVDAELSHVWDCIQSSRELKKVSHLSLTVSALFNLFAASLAVSGHMTALWAAVLMPLNSGLVLSLSYFFLNSNEAAPQFKVSESYP